jgi:hypothetical protein
MINIFQDRHSGMDCRNPDSMDGLELATPGAHTRFPAGMTRLHINMTK